jgi:hypothetical protein
MFEHYRANRALRVRATTPYAAMLRANRTFAAAVTVVGVTVSVIVNALDSATPVNAGIAGWPPVSLLLALELLVRVPIGRWYLSLVRITGTIAVSAAAGWLSYWHMVATVEAHGENGLSAHIWPGSVDGLMAIAAVAMVELGARLRALDFEARKASVEANAAALTAAVEEAVKPAMSAADGVEEMRSSDFWGARLGRPGRRATQSG